MKAVIKEDSFDKVMQDELEEAKVTDSIILSKMDY